MPGIASVSQKELAQRRKKLRRQRQMKIIQAIWQTITISSLAGGLLWVALQPIWVLKTPEQVLMKSDNQLLSQEAIKSLLVLSYPQSLWRIQPAAIAESLQKQPTIAQATVSRRLFPPGLIIEIEERIPVAVAQKRREQSSSASNKQVNTGLIDANGVWIPLEKYTLVNPQFKLPTLKVIGLPEQYASYWSKLYPYISQSSIKITEIDYQDPNNLILKTELGTVHLGATSDQLADQINLLAQLRHINTKLNPAEINYIDLTNPESPLVHMIQNKETTKNQTP
ncbi:cell division protein FtsQ/DivIB [Nostoc parmelioides]|uniref:Cell division protein FtsQ/DivIB n=1 Tax=Nostoc parmelioides FACHB-3921 TaxID=2692909 RepID=A0ABR8BQV8_9NOSO|nr:cell division protein FtsQ/DivIB [Nostoc parmelioides]MBD2255206.1 cell division protein FtsQ/DivIB [Nostoc parmelioides FACHB-3921]